MSANTLNLVWLPLAVGEFQQRSSMQATITTKTASGHALEPRAVACRQIGGYPGPCFNHAPAWKAREQYLKTTVARYANHPAMSMWDIWNEPESCLFLRKPEDPTLLCYCDN